MLFTHALLSKDRLLGDTSSTASNWHIWSSSILILLVLFPQLIQQIQSLIRKWIGIWGCLWKLHRLVDRSHLNILNFWICVWARIWLRKLIKGDLFLQLWGSWTFRFIPLWLLLWLESIDDFLGRCWEAIRCYCRSFCKLLRSLVKLDLAFLRHGGLISEMHKTLIFGHVYTTKMRKDWSAYLSFAAFDFVVWSTRLSCQSLSKLKFCLQCHWPHFAPFHYFEFLH